MEDSDLNGTQDTKNLSPFLIVKKRLMNPDCKLPAAARMVALAIADRLNTGTVKGMWGRWPVSMKDIAERSGASVATVKRWTEILCNGPVPMFSRRFVKTRDGRHVYQYALVTNVEGFVKGRDRVRQKRKREADAVVGKPGTRDVQLDEQTAARKEEFIAARADLMRRNALGELSDEEYRLELARLKKSASIETQFRKMADALPLVSNVGFTLAGTGTDCSVPIPADLVNKMLGVGKREPDEDEDEEIGRWIVPDDEP